MVTIALAFINSVFSKTYSDVFVGTIIIDIAGIIATSVVLQMLIECV